MGCARTTTNLSTNQSVLYWRLTLRAHAQCNLDTNSIGDINNDSLLVDSTWQDAVFKAIASALQIERAPIVDPYALYTHSLTIVGGAPTRFSSE